MRGMNVLRRGARRNGTGDCIHLLDSVCKSHRLQVRSSYGAEMLANAHGFDDAYPTLVTLHELNNGVLSPEQLKYVREHGGLALHITLTTDAESVYKSLTSRDLKVPTEKTLLEDVSWRREVISLGFVQCVQWCDTRDMTADGHTKGCIDRAFLLQLMQGQQRYVHPTKRFAPQPTGAHISF